MPRATATVDATEFLLAPADYVVGPKIKPEPMLRGVVYLLHFDRPISDKSPTRHYIGWAKHLPSRLIKHMRGSGARLTQVAVERGIGFVVAETWAGDRRFERKMKNRKNAPRYCPICQREHHPDELGRIDELL